MRPGTRQLLGEHARQGAALNWPILLRDTDRFYAAIDSPEGQTKTSQNKDLERLTTRGTAVELLIVSKLDVELQRVSLGRGQHRWHFAVREI